VNAVERAERVRAVLAEYGALVRVVVQDPWDTSLVREGDFAPAAQCEQLVTALGAVVAAAGRDRDALARKVDAATSAVERLNDWWRDAQAERDEALDDVAGLDVEVEQLRGEAAAADRDRDALTRLLSVAAEVEARLDLGLVSAQGAFERLLSAVEAARLAAGGAR
jgi:chromosome segregation ATPase